MMKVVVLVTIIAYTAAQSPMPTMPTGAAGGVMAAMLARNQQGLGGMHPAMMGGMGGFGRMLQSIMNNPMVLCRQTEGLEMVPCSGRFSGMCGMMSLTKYNMPGLMKCSPMGFGCCLKDASSLWMANIVN